ncbi:hypothetical protein GGX14DRAFT_384785 [Mycena pura]|uniref:Uncharacterized protein n=1 Tax=Mycena pura TaxID=153505 RepID=A0AAD6YSF8_9AGAR|nr:hypothetical protein GGX14DRAFT_384785 [Mycena pura]
MGAGVICVRRPVSLTFGIAGELCPVRRRPVSPAFAFGVTDVWHPRGAASLAFGVACDRVAGVQRRMHSVSPTFGVIGAQHHGRSGPQHSTWLTFAFALCRMRSASWAFGVPVYLASQVFGVAGVQGMTILPLKHVLMISQTLNIDLSKPRKTCQQSSFEFEAAAEMERG